MNRKLFLAEWTSRFLDIVNLLYMIMKVNRPLETLVTLITFVFLMVSSMLVEVLLNLELFLGKEKLLIDVKLIIQETNINFIRNKTVGKSCFRQYEYKSAIYFNLREFRECQKYQNMTNSVNAGLWPA